MLENLRAFETEIDGRHLSGVIHGDLKPKNIRIDSRSQIRVMDFGVAKAFRKARQITPPACSAAWLIVLPSGSIRAAWIRTPTCGASA